MFKSCFFICILSIVSSCSSGDEVIITPTTPQTPTTPVDNPSDTTTTTNPTSTIIWSDEFDQNELNQEFWNFELGDGCPNLCGWGNNELQIYTDKNHRIEDGMLKIRAELSNGVYSSTRITTQGKREFRNAYIETKAKLPVGVGIWPAFWMLGSNIESVGWPKCGEIDILEYVGKSPGEIFTSVHTQSSFGNTINTRKTPFPNIEDGFHTYGVHWTTEDLKFYVDQMLVYIYKPSIYTEDEWPFTQKGFMIINVAIGGNFGGPEVDISFPQEFVLDYVRVYDTPPF